MIEEKILTKWNQGRVRYCVLRNYDHLICKKKRTRDLDISVHKGDIKKAETILLKEGFVKRRKHFDRSHQGYAYLDKNLHKIGFDIQINGVHWNEMPYLDESIFRNRVHKGFFYTLSKDDAYVMYVCHSILGKKGRFKEEYKKALQKLHPTKKVLEQLASVFSMEDARWIIKKVSERKFGDISGQARHLILVFLLYKKRVLTLAKVFIRWAIQKKIKPYPLLACIGPDGSGKSTVTSGISEAISKTGAKTNLIYFGRGKKNILPVKKAGKLFKKREKETRKGVIKLVYTASAPIYALDLLIRYWLCIFWQRWKSIIITDRYGTDILLLPNAPNWIKKGFFSLFPKPTITLYLSANEKTLFNRKKQQTHEELKWQMGHLAYAAKKLNAVEIKTDKISAKEATRIGFLELLKRGNY